MDIYDEILTKGLKGQRLTLEEGVSLYSCDLLRLGQAADQVRWSLEHFDIASAAPKRPMDLSPIEQAIVMVARALVCEPHIVWCDDPVTTLGPEIASMIHDIMAELHKDGLTVVTTARPDTAPDWPARRIVLRAGRIVKDAPFL